MATREIGRLVTSMEPYEHLLTCKQVAEMLNVSISTVKRMEKRADIPRVELPGVGVRYRPSSIQAFIEGREVYIRPRR